MLLFVDVFYIVVAEKYPLLALEEECDLIIQICVSQVSVEPK